MTKQTSIKISIILGVILIAVLSVILIGYTKVRGIEIDVQYPSNLVIIQKNDIEQTLKKQYGDLLSYKRNQIDKDDIQLTLESNNFVHSVFVSMSPSGILRITVKQKNIVARCFNNEGSSYYVDEQGGKIFNTDYVAHCLIISGKGIDTNAYILASKINKDKVLIDWISEIYVNKKDIKLFSSQGDFSITIGDKQDWDIELQKLHYLFAYAFQSEGWDDYVNIDLRFHNQAVCTKKPTDDTLSVK